MPKPRNILNVKPKHLTDEHFPGDDLYIETNFGSEGQCLIIYQHQTGSNEYFHTRIVGSSLSAALDILRTLHSKQR